MAHRGRTVLLAASVFLSAAAGADAGESAVPSPTAQLARHAPILVLHPAERLTPSPVDGFLADADLQGRTAAGWEKVDGPLLYADEQVLAVDGGIYDGGPCLVVELPVDRATVMRHDASEDPSRDHHA